MAQIRQRQVKVQVTSADPSNKVFKGIYADSSYRTLLTQNKTYDFKLNAGQTKELYIRYSPKPVTITFKKNPNTSYKVTGSFGTVLVTDTNVVKTVEFQSDTLSGLTIQFNSIATTYSDMWIVSPIINGVMHALPYTMTNVAPGTNIIFDTSATSITTTTSTTTSTTTTTTTTSTTSTTTTTSTPAPAVLKLKSNVGGTVVKVTSDGVSPEEVSLAGTTQSSVLFDMSNAPLVDA